MATQPTSLQAARKQINALQNTIQDLHEMVEYREKQLRDMANEAKEKVSALEIQVGGSHYKSMAIQPVEYILANNLGFVEGNIIKYASRWQSKGGIKDLEKIKHFADLLIEDVRSKQESSGNTECSENRAQVGVKFNPSAFLAKELAAK